MLKTRQESFAQVNHAQEVQSWDHWHHVGECVLGDTLVLANRDKNLFREDEHDRKWDVYCSQDHFGAVHVMSSKS